MVRWCSPEIVLDGLCFPEGAYWSTLDGCLYFVEWAGDRIWRLTGNRAEVVRQLPSGDGPCGLGQDAQGNLWVCMYSSRRLVQFGGDGRLLRTIDECNGQELRGPNEVALDREGGLFFTDSGSFRKDWRTGRRAGAVYYVGAGADPVQVAAGLCYPNGIAVSLDGRRLVLNEHRRNRLLCFDVQTGGRLTGQRLLAELDGDCLLDVAVAWELGPDGLWRDTQDRLWVPHYGGGKVILLDARGQVLARILLPRGRKPTNVALDEKEGVLYVTEAEEGVLYRVLVT